MDTISVLLSFFKIKPIYSHSTDTFFYAVLSKPVPKDTFMAFVNKLEREVLFLIKKPVKEMLKDYLRYCKIRTFRVTSEENNFFVYIENSEVRKATGRSFRRWNFLLTYMKQVNPDIVIKIKSYNLL